MTRVGCIYFTCRWLWEDGWVSGAQAHGGVAVGEAGTPAHTHLGGVGCLQARDC